MLITMLDTKTLGHDLDFSLFEDFGQLEKYDFTYPQEVEQRIINSDCVIINKIKLNKQNLQNAKKLKIICIAATGYDNVDTEYCAQRGIAVCNVVGYSTYSVAQTCVAMVLSLSSHLLEYNNMVTSGKYTQSNVPNCISPTFYEIKDKTWGVLGLGNIGKQTAAVAKALGARVICCKQTYVDDYECVDFDELCRRSDIITIHLPYTSKTDKLINKESISKMKDGVMLVNVARGKILDEEAVAQAVESGKIGAFGTDVYSVEPLQNESPFSRLPGLTNVCFTPHMAWAAYESRKRLMDEIYQNIKAFENGQTRNRVV